MDEKVTFQYKNITFVLKIRDNTLVYRDEAHLGGPWSDVTKSLNNKSLDSRFRKALYDASIKFIQL